jgi:Protein of unknown function (DUF3152)
LSRKVIRRRRQVVTGVLAVALLVGGWALGRTVVGGQPDTATAVRSSPRSEPAAGTPTSTASPQPSALLSTEMRVVQHGPGTLVVVPGSQSAPDRGANAKRMTVRVEVEKGTDVDLQTFARQVVETLNDPRSWGHGGTLTFARTDAKTADIRVLLASPDTSERLCRPLQTHGTESCSIGDKAILTSYRWAKGTPEFPTLAVYREYVVNHEVGHVLGHHHQQCPGKGKVAPVMQQQTIKVAPCRPNGWPFP